jgi:hypothetical protein
VVVVNDGCVASSHRQAGGVVVLVMVSTVPCDGCSSVGLSFAVKEAGVVVVAVVAMAIQAVLPAATASLLLSLSDPNWSTTGNNNDNDDNGTVQDSVARGLVEANSAGVVYQRCSGRAATAAFVAPDDDHCESCCGDQAATAEFETGGNNDDDDDDDAVVVASSLDEGTAAEADTTSSIVSEWGTVGKEEAGSSARDESCGLVATIIGGGSG